MARYIDADKMKKYLHEDDFGTPDERWKPESEFAKMIDATPTADVVEVVRCKDCKRFMEYNEDYVREVEKTDGDCYIRKMYSCDTQFCAVKSDDFCSYGKRKE